MVHSDGALHLKTKFTKQPTTYLTKLSAISCSILWV